MNWALMNLGADAYNGGIGAINPFASAQDFNPNLSQQRGAVGAIAAGRQMFDKGLQGDLYAKQTGAQKALPDDMPDTTQTDSGILNHLQSIAGIGSEPYMPPQPVQNVNGGVNNMSGPIGPQPTLGGDYQGQSNLKGLLGFMHL